MAQRIETFDVIIPAGTLSSAPQTTALPFNPGIVSRLEILIPPGPSGLVGFRILHSSEVIIPYDATRWIIADNETLKWDLEGYPTGSAWALRAYNTDVYDHTLYLRFAVNETIRSVPSAPQLVYIAPGATAEDSTPSA